MLALTRFCSVSSRLMLAAALSLAAACTSDNLKPEPVPEPSKVFWDLMLDKHAVTLSTTAPYDTASLVATPRNYQGESLTGLPPAQFVSLNPDVVGVTSDGVLFARSSATDAAMVEASLTAGNLKHTDTVIVRVVDNPIPPALETFSVQPVAPDSAKWFAVGSTDEQTFSLTLNAKVHATYAGGTPVPTVNTPNPAGFGTIEIPDIVLSLRSSDTTVAYISREINTDGFGLAEYRLLGRRHGSVDIYASTTFFGVTKVDTLHFQVGYPLVQIVDMTPPAADASVNDFSLPSVIIGTGGVVIWRNFTHNTTAVTFTDPTNVHSFGDAAFLPADVSGSYCFLFLLIGDGCAAAGNLVSAPSPDFGAAFNGRSFPVPGVYDYHGAEGQTARIVVAND